ncbi:hypothetical protein [Paraclostridium sordellii]|nr:hypothetical protein [Paeniclostridium sordellii]
MNFISMNTVNFFLGTILGKVCIFIIFIYIMIWFKNTMSKFRD